MEQKTRSKVNFLLATTTPAVGLCFCFVNGNGGRFRR